LSIFGSHTSRYAGEATGCGLIEQFAWLDLDRLGKPAQRRDLRIALPRLHPADLRDMDAAALRNLFLGEPQAFACLPQPDAELSHGRDRPRLRRKAP